MTDQAEQAPQFIVVRETKTEQAGAQADTTQGTTQGNPFARRGSGDAAAGA